MYKQVIIVRNDLKMSKGKIAVQACHASVGSFVRARSYAKRKWSSEGQKKVVLKARNKDVLLDAARKCKKYNIIYFLVSDAGMTELKPGTITAIGIGPEKEEKINKITGSLPLLK